MFDDPGAASFRGGVSPVSYSGRVLRVDGLTVEIADRLSRLDVDARVCVETPNGPLMAEVAGLTEDAGICLPFGPLEGVRRGAIAQFLGGGSSITPSNAWLGRCIDGLARPIDGKGALAHGARAMPLRAAAPAAALRARLGPRVAFGVKAIDLFTPMLTGQRLGVFSSAGVGKSMLLSMMARNTDCDVAVIALIGERGREVREFIEDSLGAERMARSVIVVATADEPAMMRREAALTAMTIAEYFRDQGKRVLCLYDSLTRLAQAQREIGLAAGEPPTSKGYTPSVFSSLPALLERAGPGLQTDSGEAGAITGVFSVLVEGDDFDEPVADAARAILDGHVVLSRAIAEQGRFPAVDVLKSVSRTSVQAMSDDEADVVRRARRLEAVYNDMREMVRIGAYNHGSNAEVDEAITFHGKIEQFLTQMPKDSSPVGDAFAELSELLASIRGDIN